MRETTALTAALLLAALAAGCGGVPEAHRVSGRYRWKAADLTIELPGGAWRVRRMEDDSLLFHRLGTPGYFMVNISPSEAAGPVTTDVLARSLLVHLADKKVLSHGRRRIVGHEASCVMAEAQIHDETVRLKACALALGDRLLDAACWAAPEDFDAVAVRFNAFLAGIVKAGGTP